MLEKFYTDKFDDEVMIVTESCDLTFRKVKELISSAIKIIENKKQNIVICENNNLNFIIKFFACVFSQKNIFLLTDLKKLQNINIDFDLFDEGNFEFDKSFKFKKIDEKNIIINFFTSGSSSKSKMIKKSLFNLLKEGEDIGKEFDFGNLMVISTTSMCHLFGMTFHLMLPFMNNLKIYTPSIFYPDNINIENAILVSTPTFLSSIEKHKINFEVAPEYVISAGSKLKENVFKYLEERTNVIEIYGSTETGVIAHKEKSDNDFKLFNNVEIKSNEENTEIFSQYIFDDSIKINDCTEINGRNLKIKNRTDRVLKIYDKRINAEEIEQKLNENELVKESYIIKADDKLACLCALNKEGQKYFIENGISELKKYLKNYIKKYFEIIPQKWKFIDEIPRNKFGKTDKEKINQIFSINLSLPLILNRDETQDKIEYEIFFYEACNFFNGHFPSYKILAGVVQLYLAKEFANAHFNLELGQGQWKKIKFSNIILPNQIIKLELKKNEKQVEYKFFDVEKVYSSGIFLCENVFKELECI